MAEIDYYKKYTETLNRLNSDPDAFASNKVSKQKYAAKKRGISWNLSDRNIVNRLLRTTHCALSGRELIFEIDNNNSPSIDRKKSHLGYTTRNIQIVTTAVNIAKNKLSDNEFIEMCCDVASKHGWVKQN